MRKDRTSSRLDGAGAQLQPQAPAHCIEGRREIVYARIATLRQHAMRVLGGRPGLQNPAGIYQVAQHQARGMQIAVEEQCPPKLASIYPRDRASSIAKLDRLIKKIYLSMHAPLVDIEHEGHMRFDLVAAHFFHRVGGDRWRAVRHVRKDLDCPCKPQGQITMEPNKDGGYTYQSHNIPQYFSSTPSKS